MTQLPLNITPLLSYEAADFLVHQGVASAVVAGEALLARAARSAAGLAERAFQILFIQGAPRSGKTHLFFKLSADAMKSQAAMKSQESGGLYPRMREGAKDLDWGSLIPSRGCGPSDIFFVDDAHLYFEHLEPGNSGPFVSFVEELRVAGSSLVLSSATALEKFPCDQHALSRLRAGLGPVLGPPTEGEMRALVKILARQRGIALTDRKLAFLERRLPRDVKQLEEYLDRVQFISHVTGKPIRFPVLGDAL